jgi:hypothetical protein
MEPREEEAILSRGKRKMFLFFAHNREDFSGENRNLRLTCI